MRRPSPPPHLTTAVAAVALGAAGLGAGAVIGDTLEGGPGNVPVPPGAAARSAEVPVERVPAKRGASPTSRILYYETAEPLSPIPAGPGGYVFRRCPSGSAAVNGYYYQSFPREPGGGDVGTFQGFGLDDQGSSPAGYRRWAFYWENVSGKPLEGVTVGIVCDKDG